jgi:predicted alpha/beta superfamily hydrolase
MGSISADRLQSVGRIGKTIKDMIRHENFNSSYVATRHIDVWLPPGYEDEPARRYPVLYMHDGQNCFSAGESSMGVAWDVQHALARLIESGEARAAIIVGIWNLPLLRYPEYRPARPFRYLSETARATILAGLGGEPLSDDYLAFIVSELKPFIDATYRTSPDRDNTFIMGSSMGGLISLYAVCEYPEVFGGAGCVSSHWPSVEGVIIPYLHDHLPDPATHRFYFDFGNETLDALYAPLQAETDKVMDAAGYTPDHNWMTRAFPGTNHSEIAWQARVDIPLRFLLA